MNQKSLFYPNLSLFVLEHFVDACVEGRTREHGGDGIGQIQDCFKYWIHSLLNNNTERNERFYCFSFHQSNITSFNILKMVELEVARQIKTLNFKLKCRNIRARESWLSKGLLCSEPWTTPWLSVWSWQRSSPRRTVHQWMSQSRSRPLCQ